MTTKKKTDSKPKKANYQLKLGNGKKKTYQADNFREACIYAHKFARQQKTLVLTISEVD